MRFYTRTHRHYCGIDLHARTMFVCVVDDLKKVLLHVNLPSSPDALLRAIAPYREDLVIAVECTFTWYWLADLCSREKINLVLGHALYMRAVHQGKAKNDKLDSFKIAMLVAAQMMPLSYVYPAAMRATRDLMRRRLHFVRDRAGLLVHVQNVYHQYNRVSPGKKIAFAANREHVVEGFDDPSITRSLAADKELIEKYEAIIAGLELDIVREARVDDAQAIFLLRTVPGIGKILSLIILYEVHDIARFESVQQFASYSRLVRCARESGGKKLGTGGAKMAQCLSEVGLLRGRRPHAQDAGGQEAQGSARA